MMKNIVSGGIGALLTFTLLSALGVLPKPAPAPAPVAPVSSERISEPRPTPTKGEERFSGLDLDGDLVAQLMKELKELPVDTTGVSIELVDGDCGEDALGCVFEDRPKTIFVEKEGFKNEFHVRGLLAHEMGHLQQLEVYGDFETAEAAATPHMSELALRNLEDEGYPHGAIELGADAYAYALTRAESGYMEIAQYPDNTPGAGMLASAIPLLTGVDLGGRAITPIRGGDNSAP